MNFFRLCQNNINNKYMSEVELAEKKLKEINEKDVEYFSFKGKIFYAKPCHIYDGDTFSSIFEFKDEIIKYKCRAMGYDTAEMKPKLNVENREYEKELAKKAKERFTELLNKHPSGLVKIECLEFDKYGRLLVNIWNHIDEESINDLMIKEGHGKKYLGGKKEEW